MTKATFVTRDATSAYRLRNASQPFGAPDRPGRTIGQGIEHWVLVACALFAAVFEFARTPDVEAS